MPEAPSRRRRARSAGQAGSSVRPGTACSAAFSKAATACGPARSSAATWSASTYRRVASASRAAGSCWSRCRVVAERAAPSRARICSSRSVGVDWVDRVGPDDAVRVAVPDGLQVEVVRGPAAGQHGVELLPGLLTGGEAVHGVDGESLRGVHGGGVAELGGGLYVSGGESDAVPVAQVLDVKIAAGGDREHGPAVTVFDPVGRCQSQLPVVAAGDDQFTDTGPIPVSQRHIRDRLAGGVWASRWLRARWLSWATSSRVGASMIESSPVERSCCQAVNTCSVRVERSPTWIRWLSR